MAEGSNSAAYGTYIGALAKPCAPWPTSTTTTTSPNTTLDAAHPAASTAAFPSRQRSTSPSAPAKDRDVIREMFPERFPAEEEERLLAAAAAHKASGNTLYATKHYLAAIDAYELALTSTPIYLDHPIAILHSNIAACHLAVNAHSEALLHANKAIARRPGWSKALLRRCRAREGLGAWKDLEAAAGEYEQLLAGKGEGGVELEEVLGERERRDVQTAVKRVESVVEGRKEVEVAEAVKSLKEMGNGILKPFGLSTNDFGMVKGSDGGYSLSFQRGGT